MRNGSVTPVKSGSIKTCVEIPEFVFIDNGVATLVNNYAKILLFSFSINFAIVPFIY